MLRVLAQFSRLVTTASAAEMWPLLVDAAIRDLGADGAAVLQVEDDVARVVVARQLPAAINDWRASAETIGAELGDALRAACGASFTEAHTLPLVAGGDLFGVLVLLSRRRLDLEGERLELARSLVDLTAAAMAKAEQLQQLQRSFEELRASRDTMATSEKLRALGQLAGGVSHDLVNILNPLNLQLSLLKKRITRDPPAALELVDQMIEVVKTGISNVERLRNFSRQQPEAAAEPTDLNRLLVTAVELSRARAQGCSRLVIDHRPGTPPLVLARAAELTTAVVNLMLNAIEVLPEGGTITVTTGAADGGGWVEVADDGPGMSPEVRARVFEPFFTTKKEGTGLGLAMVYAFVQRQGGKLTLDTTPGHGARFRMWFPAAGG